MPWALVLRVLLCKLHDLYFEENSSKKVTKGVLTPVEIDFIISIVC